MMNNIYDLLYEEYGAQGWWPLIVEKDGKYNISYKDEYTTMKKNKNQIFEICIGAVLTQNTNWNNAGSALINLKQNGLIHPEAILQTDQQHLANLIKSSGYFNQKSRKLKELAKFIMQNKEITRETVLGVWGIGFETADDIMLYAYDKEHFVVDTYTKRIFSRIGLCSENIEYNSLKSLIEKSIKRDLSIYKEFHALLDNHAKIYCKRKPVCGECPLNSICDFANKRT